MMKNLMYVFISAVLFTAASCSQCCGDGQCKRDDKAQQTTEITHKVVAGTSPQTMANLAISGMTCAAGCGEKIQHELRALGGVMGTALDFSENREKNIVSVEYDPEKINEQQLIQCVHNMADGQYHVDVAEIVTVQAGDTPVSGKEVAM